MLKKLKHRALPIICLSALCRFAACQGAQPSPGVPSLHLVAVVPTYDSPDSYDPEIYRLAPDGSGLKSVYVLQLEKGGLHFILASFRSRRIVFAWPHVVPTNLCIVNMDAVGSPTILPLEFSDVPASAWSPLAPDLLRYSATLAKPSNNIFVLRPATVVDRPGVGGHWLTLQVGSFRGDLIAGYQLDLNLQREILDRAALSHLRVQGDFGLASDLGDSDARFANVRDGKVFVGQADIGLPAPEGTEDPKVQWRLVAHDGNISVMYRHMLKIPLNGGPHFEPRLPPNAEVRSRDQPASSDRNCVTRLYIRAERSGEWKTRQVPGLEPRVKMIDSWVMGAAVCEALGRESPGAAERRRYQERYREEAAKNHRREGRLPTDQVFLTNNAYLPGILFLIDATTGRYFEISTGQGDSEILLVHNQTVYYRVNDGLFSAPLQENSVGQGKLLVRHDAIPDVHWAFWGSE